MSPNLMAMREHKRVLIKLGAASLLGIAVYGLEEVDLRMATGGDEAAAEGSLLTSAVICRNQEED